MVDSNGLMLGTLFCVLLGGFLLWPKKKRYEKHLLVFSKYPTPGKAKTRLIPSLGEEVAAQVQRIMTEELLSCLQDPCLDDVMVHVVSNSDPELMREWLSRRFTKVDFQGYNVKNPNDLGAVLTAAFQNSFVEGSSAIAIGSDIPGIKPSIILEAFEKLKGDDVVLGPAKDGGYYLIGVNRQQDETIASLFDSSRISWGTEKVFEQQSKQAESLVLSLCSLPHTLSDVDDPEDIPTFESETGIRTEDMKDGKLSIVVSLRNSSARIEPMLRNITASASDKPVEVILSVASSSTDDTLAKCKEHAAQLGGKNIVFKILEAPRSCVGRGAAYEYATRAATGSYLLFLHDDCKLPDSFDEIVKRDLDTPGVSAGAFSFAADIPSDSTWQLRATMRFVEYAVKVRMKREDPYGDQAIHVSRRFYNTVGGFSKSHYLFEDVELISKLRKIGRIIIADETVISSSKRWQKSWFSLKNTFLNRVYVLLYNFGVTPRTLFSWYYGFDPVNDSSE